MKPIAVFRFSATEGPGYFATFLERNNRSWKLIAVDDGDRIPETVDAYSGIALMGGPMSVNDPLPWIDPLCARLREASAQAMPIIGHCLGGQLLSKALGGVVTHNAVKEIGWSRLAVEPTAHTADWLGQESDAQTVFQWHGETFSIPPGATRIATNAWCANQIFVAGPHLGMQCHIEMTPVMIETWCEAWAAETHRLPSLPACVQTPAAMIGDAARHIPAMRQLAERLYGRWLEGLKGA
jgi:GMP synthase-like glutamine amidotransferase